MSDGVILLLKLLVLEVLDTNLLVKHLLWLNSSLDKGKFTIPARLWPVLSTCDIQNYLIFLAISRV